jgi:hypothetical protein
MLPTTVRQKQRHTLKGISSTAIGKGRLYPTPEGCDGKEIPMGHFKHTPVDTSMGSRAIDTSGSAVSVVRMDASRSYAGVGQLLQKYINQSDEHAWELVKSKIDYTYQNLDLALGPLDAETAFGRDVKLRIEKGQRLLFKPNLVSIFNIDPQTHGPGLGSTTCTEWSFVAALMRWFHDRFDISYHAMAVGDAGSMTPAAAGLFTMMSEGRPVTTEAAIEGRAGDFYGGWGFYFVRRYLAESHDSSHHDDPVNGYQESVNGVYVPPGIGRDKLMVYDLNKVSDNPSKGRVIAVGDGVNFQRITLHKAIVGGDPSDPEDLKAYPGSVLVNVPKLKVHAITLLTGAVKNLGIGLYPMQAQGRTGAGDCHWLYGSPWNAVPGLKGGLPHSVWVPETDPLTGQPKTDSSGKPVVKKTGGILATMADIIKAVAGQGTYVLHIVDAIEAINLDHTGRMPGTREAEGLVVAGLDPVAVDLLCARYMFGSVPFDEAERAGVDDGNGGHFAQRVPVPTLESDQIVTSTGYDCAIARDDCFRYAENRGLGTRRYHVAGKDRLTDSDILSVQGHLGIRKDGRFVDLVTKSMYYDAYKVPWDLQLTSFKYFEAVDKLTGSSLKKEFLEAFDENGDGVVGYEEFGRNGLITYALAAMGNMGSVIGSDKLGVHRGNFAYISTVLKLSNPLWSSDGFAPFKHFSSGTAVLIAYMMSLMDSEMPDPFVAGLTWGKGKWPSYDLASYVSVGIMLYDVEFPNKVGMRSLYGMAFCYADLVQNNGRYTGDLLFEPRIDGAHNYIASVLSGQAKPLDFIVYVPPGYGNVGGTKLPNVEETNLPDKVFSAVLKGGEEVWNGAGTR